MALTPGAALASWPTRNFNLETFMPVEVILKTKIEGLGSEADIVSVKPGYARNFLIPKDFAAPATLATKRQIEVYKSARSAQLAARP